MMALVIKVDLKVCVLAALFLICWQYRENYYKNISEAMTVHRKELSDVKVQLLNMEKVISRKMEAHSKELADIKTKYLEIQATHGRELSELKTQLSSIKILLSNVEDALYHATNAISSIQGQMALSAKSKLVETITGTICNVSGYAVSKGFEIGCNFLKDIVLKVVGVL